MYDDRSALVVSPDLRVARRRRRRQGINACMTMARRMTTDITMLLPPECQAAETACDGSGRGVASDLP
jgi:hypothetical protein